MKDDSTRRRRARASSEHEGDTLATHRIPARTLGQMAAVKRPEERQTQLIPQPPSRAVTSLEPAARRTLLMPQATQRFVRHAGRAWRVRTLLAVLMTVLVAFGYIAIQAAQAAPHTGARAAGLGYAALHAVQTEVAPPDASGHGPSTGPWASSAASVIVLNAPAPAANSNGEPCNDGVKFLPVMDQWAVPPGCYANIYRPNPANYPFRPGFGWCNWWVRVHHLGQLDITENLAYRHDTKPVPGAAIFFYGNVQGADSAGHWAQVVAIAPDNYWILISEMNFDWRGAGWGKVDYRYVHAGPGVIFTYP
jgi:hypothetical protein